MKGQVSKRCSCTAEELMGRSCKKAHGSWQYVADLGPGRGKDGEWRRRRQERRGRFPTKAAAEQALAELLAELGHGNHAHDQQLTVGAYLDDWLHRKESSGLNLDPPMKLVA